MINTRNLVVAALKETMDGGYSNLILKKHLTDNQLSFSDSKFASALFYGVLERKITLDYIIEKQSGRKLRDISDIALNAIRIGLYQMLYMDKVPDSAAINESVKIVKKSKKSFLSGFTNAVLRNCQRNINDLLPKGETNEDLSIIYSCPLWIINSFIKDYGKQTTIKFLKDSLTPSKVVVKVNTCKIEIDDLINQFTAQNIECEKCEIDNYLILKNSGNLAENELYNKGFFHVQDLASAKAVEDLGAVANDTVLDICAAPGGKSFSIAQAMENKGLIYSCDIHSHRVELIKKGAERLGLKIIKPIVNDATRFNDSFPKFDKILCDVPCSGLGVIGRKPDIKYNTENNLEELEQIQFDILNTAKSYLKDTGRIVYSTCTLRKKENEDIINRFISQNKDFKTISINTLFPHKNGTDGFFVAVLER